MIKLDSYDVLNNEVFYRGIHILDYLYSNKRLDDMDIEAIQNTILSALVERKLIVPEKQFLDLRKMAIVDEFYFGCVAYNNKPFVQGFPLWLKEKMRRHSLHITGSLPISLHAARPAGDVHYCIYDANTALSSLFDDCAFLVADYDSPTRFGVRATDRPFLEVTIEDTVYLIDILTKRMFECDEFKRRYNMTIKHYVRKSDFSGSAKQAYEEDIKEETLHYGSYLSITLPLFESLRTSPDLQEFFYELDKSKEYYPRAFEEVDEIYEDMKSLKFISSALIKLDND